VTIDPWELADVDLVGHAELVRRAEITAAEVAEAAIARIEALNPALNAVVTPMYERALRAAGDATGSALAGSPFLLKDLIVEVEGVRFTEGSRFLRDNVSRYTSELVRRLEQAGVVILGKTSTPEFGMAPTCEAQLFGPTRNPWDLTRSTSGSSGGSAAAVASRMVPAAHGNDLGGSIRYPASACGVFGLKPTRARNPLGPEYGDAVSGGGVEHALTRTVRDSAALLDATSGPMAGDPYPAPPVDRPFLDEVGADPGRLRIAFTSTTADGIPGHPDCVAALDDAVGLCGSLGHEMREVPFPTIPPAAGEAIGTMFMAATAWIIEYWTVRLGREPGPDELEPLTRAYYDRGRHVTAGAYLAAIEELQRMSRSIAAELEGYDALLTPTMSSPPLPIGEMTSTPEEPLRALERSGPTIAYAGVLANITGNPAMSVPLHWSDDGLPIGVHFLGRFGGEATLFRLASQLEAARPWADREPGLLADMRSRDSAVR
jgi:amidase